MDAGAKTPAPDSGTDPSEEDAGEVTPEKDAGRGTPEEDGGREPGQDDAGTDDAGTDDAGTDDAGTDDAGTDDAGPLLCEPFFANCDLDPENGCETAINTVNNCGMCGRACAPANAIGDCSSGSCEIGSCEAGYRDCDGDPANGCETPVDTLDDCGVCGNECAPENAIGDCSSGTCEIASCLPGYGDCDGDPSNGCETPLNTADNCGECGERCSPDNATGECSSGICEIGSCDEGFGDCDEDPESGCEMSLTTEEHCGACGVPCAPAGGVGDCSTGTCQVASCAPGAGDCDGDPRNGCETNTRTNTHCGGCGIPCSHENGFSSCASGSCKLIGCGPGWGNCDGDEENGCEQPLNTQEHCGACGNSCDIDNGFATCSNERCSLLGCDIGWDNCDGELSNGCEQPLNTLDHCGSCGAPCSLDNASATCGSGSCEVESCDALWGDCDNSSDNGCETSLETTSNCGACGQACSFANASASCAGGTCQFGSCHSGYSNCDGNVSNGCELRHLSVSGSCGSGVDVGSFRGDSWCGTPGICWSEAQWAQFASREGRNSSWYKARAVEEDDCSTPVEHRITLEVPSGIDYDLYVYRSCGTVAASSKRGTGQNESVIIRQEDRANRDDSFNYFVEVRYVSGRSCSRFKIKFEGRTC